MNNQAIGFLVGSAVPALVLMWIILEDYRRGWGSKDFWVGFISICIVYLVTVTNVYGLFMDIEKNNALDYQKLIIYMIPVLAVSALQFHLCALVIDGLKKYHETPNSVAWLIGLVVPVLIEVGGVIGIFVSKLF